MSEAATEAAPAQEQPEQPEETPTDWQAEATKLREELTKARKWEERAKENRKAADELERQRQAAMTETERAVAEAEARGRTAATQDFGKRLATSEIRAAAGEAGADLTGVFDYLDLSRFVGEDGEPDSKAIKGFVDALPKRSVQPAPLDLGQRGTPAATQDFNAVLRRAAGRA